jgi:diguanylate cyclase (GGDEF)-like protein
VAVQAMKAGAQDYLVKGRFDENDLARAIQNAIDKVEMARSIEIQRQELERLAVTDELTGLHNRRWFVQRLDEEVQRALRYNTPLCLMLIDVDRFKDINDSHGHLAGDLVLCHFAAILRRRFRETDFAARLGGDEFVGLLAGTPLDGAMEVAERLRRELREDPVPVATDVALHVTCSIGVAELDATTPSAIALLQGADSALYESKERGRNCVSAHQAPSSE